MFGYQHTLMCVYWHMRFVVKYRDVAALAMIWFPMDVGPCFQFTKCNAAKLATLIWAALLVISNNHNYLSMLCL
jgi:hypothetical protein